MVCIDSIALLHLTCLEMVGKATITTTTTSLKFADFHIENETNILLNMKWSVNQ
jgi:hypothetical protein